jgi:hypothetical protein
MDEGYDYHSAREARRKERRDARILNRIMKGRDFDWAVRVMFAPVGTETGMCRMVHTLIRLGGADALKKEVDRQCKKGPRRPRSPISDKARMARWFLREGLSPNLTAAVCAVIGGNTRHSDFYAVHNAAYHHATEIDARLDEFMDTLKAGARPEELDITDDPEELFKRSPEQGF